jgi:cathepsin A (carboxypeptidase C)
MAKEFYEFLTKFYQLFPEYNNRPLYLTGESFAGHFIPYIAT